MNYSINYIKIYFWQFISIVLNFLSMFIVVPYLTSNPNIYGIYTVCISISTFLVYADLGFVSAGQKYASEYFAKGNRIEEMRVIGFTNFILIVFLLLLSATILYLSIFPEMLIKKMANTNELNIASRLLFILAIFTPVTMLQRLSQMVFAIRLEDFIVQRTNIIANLIKIVSVLYFFRNNNYDIIGYFLFTQLLNLTAILITFSIAKTRFSYDIKTLLMSIRFNNVIFKKTKGLAFTSLFSLFTWILYYELDPAVIGKRLGAKEVAIFAIGLTIMSFFRSILGSIFGPFSVRFNHFIGLKDTEGLKTLCKSISTITAPLVIIPIVALILLSNALILSWVGSDYAASVLPARFLIACNGFAFLTYPCSLLLMAQERIKIMYIVNAALPIIYWIGIGCTFSYIGVNAFGVFKFVAFFINAFFCLIILKRYFQMSFLQVIQNYFLPVILPIVFLIVSFYFLSSHLPLEKSKMNLFRVGGYAFIMIGGAFGVLYFTSNLFKSQFKKIITATSNDKKNDIMLSL
jgi:O-antigen/teichoic acid export membrane protein